ncbi:MAG: PP2C family protein-serine/threonine phosphatase [Phycisphaerales bacterium]
MSINPAKPLLCVTHGGLDSDFVRRWTAELLGAWPASPSPGVRCVPLPSILESLERPGTAPPEESLLVLLAHSRTSPIEVDRFVGAAENVGLPAVIVLEDAEAWRPLQRHGVLFVEPSASPTIVAAMCYALAERQAAVGMLAGEVRIAQRCEAGVRGEIERMYEELNLAASIQREFTSAPMPRVRGLEFGLLYRPMNFVSGDIYNVHSVDPKTISFLVADVVGHGVPAALLTMVLSNSLAGIERNACAEGVLRPGAVLKQLNARLCESATGGRFATAVYGVLNTESRSITLAGAGHPPPVVVRGDSPRAVETDGPLLGIFDDAEFDECDVTLGDGDAMYIYTDGLDLALREEAGPGARTPSTERIGKLLAAMDRSGQDGMEAAMYEMASLLDGSVGSLHQSDDVTVLGVRALREGASGSRRAAA